MSGKTVLTDEAIDEIREKFDFDGFMDQNIAKRVFARAIEAAVLAAQPQAGGVGRRMRKQIVCVKQSSRCWNNRKKP